MSRERVGEWGLKGQGLIALFHEPGRTRYVVEAYVNGRRNRQTFRYHTKGTPKTVAKAEARACAEKAHDLRAIRSSRTESVTTMASLYERYVVAMEGGWREPTRATNRYRWQLWIAFIKPTTSPEDVTEDTLDEFVKALRTNKTAPNQIRQTVALIRAVYKLGLHRKWVTQSGPLTYKLRMKKNERSLEPAEYHPDEWKKIVSACDPSHPGQWRLYVTLLLQGAQGQRISSVRQLEWKDVDEKDATILWPGDRMKQGRDFLQPLTRPAQEALEVAREWRAAEGYDGPHVLYAPGRAGGKGGRNTTGWGNGPVAYATIHAALLTAEKRAGVAHKKFRATHGTRKMAAGNVYARTGSDLLAAAEWIGDSDTKQLRHYLKRHSERIIAGAAAAEQGATVPNTVPKKRKTRPKPRRRQSHRSDLN